MERDEVTPPSPNSSPERQDDVPLEKTVSAGSTNGKETTSLKRGREGSLEPYPAETPQTPAVTKKNRLAPASSLGEGQLKPVTEPVDVEVDEPEPVPEAGTNDPKARDEGRTVGEVRRKVEKMTYEEGGPSSAVRKAENEPKDLPNGDEADHAMEKPEETGNDSGEWEKIDKSEVEDVADGLKRKTLDRSGASFPQPEDGGEGVKRQKETPSPPAAPPEKKPATSFSAFSSTASPFTAVRSASPFATATPTKPSPSPFASTGFGNYSSTFSPFGAKKTGPIVPADVYGEKEDEAGPSRSTFGDILTAMDGEKGDGEQKVHITEQEVPTGEEEEETLYQTRVKLYVMQSDGGWKERGTGTLKLNIRRADGRGARLVMRAEGVLRLILNVSLYAGMACLEDGKYVRTTVFEEKERRFITFRTASNKTATELSGAILEAIPLESGSAANSKSPDPRAADDTGAAGDRDRERGEGVV